MRYGTAIGEAIEALNAGRELWDISSRESWEAHDDLRGDACGLAVGEDEPVGYLGVPDEFRAFLGWGVDGVHEGLWIDSPDQRHSPTIVMVSPMDTDAIRVEARDATRWLDLLRLGDFNDHWDAWEDERRAAIDQRRKLGLPTIPREYELPDEG